MARLTLDYIKKLELRDKPYVVYDDKLTGFGMRILPSGVKTWQVEYRPHPGGRGVPKRRMSLGATTKVTPDQARKLAQSILHRVAIGEDPMKDKSAKRKQMTVAGLVDEYEKDGCRILRGKRQGEEMKPLTRQYTLSRLRHHVVPLLGKKGVTDVTHKDVETMSRDIAAGKTAKDEKTGPRRRIIVKGGAGAARKVVRDLSALFSFAQHEGLVRDNPVENAKVRKTDERRTRYLSLEEVNRLGAALNSLEAQGTNPKAIDITRLWALTGCRRNEIAALKWSEVDFEQSCLRLDDTKTGKSIRPLAAPALALLAAIQRQKGSPFVFPATSGNGYYQGTKQIWPKAIKKAELPGVTPHTLRHTLGSTSVSVGETLVMTGAILGHSETRSTAIYAHVQQDPSARAAGRVVDPIAAALRGELPDRPRAVKTGENA
jgi:integrase